MYVWFWYERLTQRRITVENLKKLLEAYDDLRITKAEFNAKLEHFILIGEFTEEEADEYINNWVQ